MGKMNIQYDHSEEAKFAKIVKIAKERNLNHVFITPQSSQNEIETNGKAVILYVAGRSDANNIAIKLKKYLKRHDIFSLEVYVGRYKEYPVKAHRRGGTSGDKKTASKSRNGSGAILKGGGGTNNPSDDGDSENGGSEW